MTQHKVISDDSFSAMDEISKVLGNEAVILSTKKVGDKVEIMVQTISEIFQNQIKRNLKKKNFKELFSKYLSNNNSNINKFDNSKITQNEVNKDNNTSICWRNLKMKLKIC